jgi:crotonobetainyl-CoA:carnitine CoA-transferase CaiB-like acyl-CoA transferase
MSAETPAPTIPTAPTATAPGKRGGPLAGRLVVDLSRALAGPHAGMMLGDLGARVIKVETPGTGDDTRAWGPPFVGPEDDRQATYFLSCNRNKESIALDLKSDDGRSVLTELLRRADVVIENFRTGVLDRLGFSTDAMHELNPGLVILSITGFGHDGPEAKRSGYDQIVQGEAGLMSLTGPDPDNPQRVGVPIADLLSGMYGAYGAVAALLEREQTGRGQVVRTSLLASIIGVHAFQGTRTTVAGEVPQAQGNHHPSIAPYGLFSCRGGKVQISVGSEKLWAAFTTAFGIDAARPDFATNADRVGHRELLISVIEDAFSAYEAEPLLTKLNEAGIPAGKVRTLDEVYAWEQVHSQGLLTTVHHAVLGDIDLPGPPLRFFDGRAETTLTEHAAPPLLDGDGAAIRAWLARTGPEGTGA